MDEKVKRESRIGDRSKQRDRSGNRAATGTSLFRICWVTVYLREQSIR